MISTMERPKTEEASKISDEFELEAAEQLQMARIVEVERPPRSTTKSSEEALARSDLTVASPVVPDYYARLATMEVDWSLARLSPGQSTK
jgi:hypothetical protein